MLYSVAPNHSRKGTITVMTTPHHTTPHHTRNTLSILAGRSWQRIVWTSSILRSLALIFVFAAAATPLSGSAKDTDQTPAQIPRSNSLSVETTKDNPIDTQPSESEDNKSIYSPQGCPATDPKCPPPPPPPGD